MGKIFGRLWICKSPPLGTEGPAAPVGETAGVVAAGVVAVTVTCKSRWLVLNQPTDGMKMG